MKKIILTLTIIFLTFSNYTFAEDDFSGSGKLDIRNKLLENRNNILEENNKELEEKYFKILEETKTLKDIKREKSNLENQNSKLKEDVRNLQNTVISKKETEIIVINYFKNILKDFSKQVKTEGGGLTFFILYILSAIFLYLFFIIYTLPLRFIRFIFRKITGYKECDPKLKDDHNNILKYNKILIQEKGYLSQERDYLLSETSELMNLNKRLNEEKNKKEDEIVFSFDDINTSKIEIEEIKSIEKKSNKGTNTENNILKEKTNIFGRKKNKKFSLGGDNEKSSLFD
ncbi:MAG: hypothetical protein Q9M94_01180 [Candidatus Gracilibacteria bacterium]|nr:hypothetical protein [Candidatus Gracilibacteria bacterium]